MALRQNSHTFIIGLLTLLPLSSLSPSALAQAKAGLFARAESIVDADVNKTVSATVWLNRHNQQELDATVSNAYRKGSPTYHQWLKPADLARFAPSAAEAQAVSRELTSKGLAVTAVDSHSMFLRVQGTVGNMQSAFNTQIKNLTIKGKVVQATTTTPKLVGAAASSVSAITGLSERRMLPGIKRPVDPATGTPYPGVPVKSAPNGIFYSSECFRGVQTHLFKTPGAALPVAAYLGNRYGQNNTNSGLGDLAPCGYSSANLTTAYGLNAAYNKGLDGTGQTIVIVDAYGSPTIQSDANVFSSINKLPQLTSSNFQVINPLGPAQATDPDNLAGWEAETTLDVEWAHSFAPGANIVLLIAPSNNDNDLGTTLFYGVVSFFGSVISNSYSGIEYLDLVEGSPTEFIYNGISELAAGFGMAVQFSTGDYGDYTPITGVPSVSDTGASPYATSVGGTSVGVNKSNKINFQTGWGNNATQIANPDGSPVDPPLPYGFQGGANGGESVVFPKPRWQSSLPGTGRQQPDVSLDADPFTGVEIVITSGGEQIVQVYGGTSLACPSFSAIWAIANQRAGQLYGEGTTLGQAAPIIASLAGTKAMIDILPASSPTNVAGLIDDSGGATFYSPDTLAGPLENTTEYVSDLANGGSGAWFTLTFGTDTSLVTTPGWDNVTGFGSPNGLAFINAAALQ